MSIVDTAKVELFRLSRDRAAVFWGFFFVPSAYLLVTLALDLAPVSSSRDAIASMDPILRAARALAMGGNPFLHVFVAIGAVAVYGAEYHHATWRLIGPRAPRSAFYLAKTATFILLASASLTLMAAVSAGFGWAAIVIGRVLPPKDGLNVSSIPPTLAVSILELAVVGLFCSLVVVLTRSRLAAVIATLFFSIGQIMAESYFTPAPDGGWWLASPVFASDFVRASVLPADGVPSPPLFAIGLAWLSLLLWCGLFSVAALAVLRSQDWSRE